jgi:signal peptidase I
VQDGRSRWDALKERAPGLHRFLTRGDAPWPFVRDVAIGGLVILLVLSSMWVYTGRWGHSPVVVVESGSMMHCSNGLPPYGRDCDSGRFGRLGTIDPGDLILVKDAGGVDVAGRAGGGEHHYGAAGDVIVYQPSGDAGRVPVIHRAMAWVDVNADGTYSVPDLGLHRIDDLDHPELQALGLKPGFAAVTRNSSYDAFCGPAGPGRSGFITRGDNNAAADQGPDPHPLGDISVCFAQPEHLLGVARGELPWLGLVKLYVTDVLGGGCPIVPAGDRGNLPDCNFYNASGDAKILLLAVLGLLVGGPYAYEKVKQRRQASQPPPPS